jgi:uncharacterized protein (DUF58 family)
MNARARRELWRKRWRELRAWMRPPRELKVTRFGWFFLLVTLGVGIAAINTENNLLYLVLGLLLGLISASGMLSEMVIRELAVECHYPGDSVAGRPFLFEVRVKNTKRRQPTFAVQIEDRARGGVVGKTFIFRLAAGETVSRAVEGLWPRRGKVELEDVRISTRFPFGLFEKAIVADWAREFIVLPRAAADAVALEPQASRSGVRPAGKVGAGSDLFALRPWQPADGVRKIHWRKSAGGAGLQSKVYEAEQYPEATLALVPGGDVPLEQAITMAARWIDDMEAQGHQVGLVCDTRIYPGRGPAHRLALLRKLALFDGKTQAPLRGDERVLRFGA